MLNHTANFKMFLQTQMFKWTRLNLKTNELEIVQVQGALRECMGGFYEYVFPEECLFEVLTMLNITPQTGKATGAKFDNGISKMRLFALRKLIGHGIKPIPQYIPQPTNRFIPMDGVVIYPIGIKYDLTDTKEDWGYRQEML